jgi:hypothetical protein
MVLDLPKELLSAHEYLSWAGVLMVWFMPGGISTPSATRTRPQAWLRLTQKRASGILNNAKCHRSGIAKGSEGLERD